MEWSKRRPGGGDGGDQCATGASGCGSLHELCGPTSQLWSVVLLGVDAAPRPLARHDRDRSRWGLARKSSHPRCASLCARNLYCSSSTLSGGRHVGSWPQLRGIQSIRYPRWGFQSSQNLLLKDVNNSISSTWIIRSQQTDMLVATREEEVQRSAAQIRTDQDRFDSFQSPLVLL